MTTFALSGKIAFAESNGRPAFEINRFCEFETDSSWKNLTSTATVVLPRKTADFNRYAIKEVFQEGNPVSIFAGYNNEDYEEFAGYISKIEPGIPIVLRLEDEMYALKRKTISVSNLNISLRELLTICADGREVDCDDTKIGKVFYDSVYASQILDDLKKQDIHCFFRGKVLTAMKVCDSNAELVQILLERTAGENLKDKSIEKVLVKVVSHRKFGKNLKFEYGEEGGTTIKFEQNGLTQAEIEVIAKSAYARAKTPGLEGEITLWGVPRITHGMRIELDSTMYPERKGVFYVNAVKKRLSKEVGFKQIVTLGDTAV